MYSIEAVDIARRAFGDERVAEIIAFFYRMRVGTKPENPVEQELKKEKWWLDKREEILDEVRVEETSRPSNAD